MSEFELMIRTGLQNDEEFYVLCDIAKEAGVPLESFVFSALRGLTAKVKPEPIEFTAAAVAATMRYDAENNPDKFFQELCEELHRDGDDFAIGVEAREWVRG